MVYVSECVLCVYRIVRKVRGLKVSRISQRNWYLQKFYS